MIYYVVNRDNEYVNAHNTKTKAKAEAKSLKSQAKYKLKVVETEATGENDAECNALMGPHTVVATYM